MKVINPRAYLNEEVKSCILAEELLFSNQVEQISFRGVFKSQVNSGFVFETGVKPTDILMIQLFLDSYFSYQRLFDFAAAERLFLYFLNSNLNASWLVPSKLYLTIRPFSQVGLFGLDELKIVLLDVGQQLFKPLLLGC